MSNPSWLLNIDGDAGAYAVPVAGSIDPLKVWVEPSRCGNIDDGVAFEFGRNGGWVVPLESLREIVRLADEYRAEILKPEDEA